jgi:hypothetical protein
MEELSDTDIDFGELIPKEIVDKGGQAIDELLPDKSKKRYEEEYSSFEKWMDRNRVKIVEEVVLLAYFKDLVCSTILLCKLIVCRSFIILFGSLQRTRVAHCGRNILC